MRLRALALVSQSRQLLPSLPWSWCFFLRWLVLCSSYLYFLFVGVPDDSAMIAWQDRDQVTLATYVNHYKPRVCVCGVTIL